MKKIYITPQIEVIRGVLESEPIMALSNEEVVGPNGSLPNSPKSVEGDPTDPTEELAKKRVVWGVPIFNDSIWNK